MEITFLTDDNSFVTYEIDGTTNLYCFYCMKVTDHGICKDYQPEAGDKYEAYICKVCSNTIDKAFVDCYASIDDFNKKEAS